MKTSAPTNLGAPYASYARTMKPVRSPAAARCSPSPLGTQFITHALPARTATWNGEPRIGFPSSITHSS
eukprot:3057365-Prymnesium_polylepis.1